MTEVPKLSLSIEGQAVAATDVSFDAEDGYGFRTLTATITRADALRLNVRQGSNVTLWESAAQCHFDGHLTGPPTLRVDGKAEITANAWALKAEKRTDPLPYITFDPLQFEDAKDAPFNFAADVRRLQVEAKPNQLWFKVENGTPITIGDHRSLVIWVPGGIITEISFRKNFLVNTAADDFRVQEFDGPSGTTTQLGADIPISAGDGTTVTRTGGTQDGLAVRLRVLTTRTPSINNRIEFDQLKVFGRHPDGTGPTVASPTWKPSDVLNDIAAILGVDTKVHISTMNIAPLWETAGNSFLDVMSTVTDLEDSHFGFYERGKLISGFWDDSPIWYVRNGSHVDLRPNVIHPQVQVTWRTSNDVPRRVLKTNADALALYGENTFEVDLPDPQSDSVLANLVGDTLLPIVSEESYSGTIQTTEYRDQSGAIHPYGPRPGHRLCIEDWGPGKSYTGRITSVSGRQGEPLTIGIEGAEASIDHILLGHDLKAARKRGRKRHRKRARGRAGQVRKAG